MHRNSSSPSDFKLRFAVVSTSYIADRIIDAAKLEPRFELVAVYSRTQENANRFAEKHGISHTFISLEQMAKSDLFDAVYIASPNSCHASQALLFLENGKHVLCEKPLASNQKEVRRMIACAKEKKLTLMEAVKTTLTPNFINLKNQLYKLGAIRNYFACFCQYSSRYDSFKAGEILNAFQPELSNGALVDIGIYGIYPMVVLFGRPKSVKAIGLMLHSGVDGQGTAVFEYENMNATVLYSKLANSHLRSEIQGEEGSMLIDKINLFGDIKFIPRSGDEEQLSTAPTENDYCYELREFIDLVEAGECESKINSFDNSLITMELMDEVRRQIGLEYPADKL